MKNTTRLVLTTSERRETQIGWLSLVYVRRGAVVERSIVNICVRSRDRALKLKQILKFVQCVRFPRTT